MTTSPSITSWFKATPLPCWSTEPLMVIGGAHLALRFLDEIALGRPKGELGITVPFVEEDFTDAWVGLNDINHREIDLFMVVKRDCDVAAAVSQLSPFPWRSLRIARAPSLHAKVFTFVSSTGLALALIGSHNLTKAAICLNYEAGILIGTRCHGELTAVIADLHETSKAMLLSSGTRVDSHCWPPVPLTEKHCHE